jgi:hypothetical protein
MGKRVLLSAFIVTIIPVFGFGVAKPNVENTPGILCTKQDPDFDGFEYAEKVARCRRDIDVGDKRRIAEAYGNLPQGEWSKYEFDHLIPICAGGSNDLRNVWPQRLDEAKEKDKIEVQVCAKMRAGTMTQKQAVAQLASFFKK